MFAVIAALVLIVASIAQFVAWIGMLLESAPLQSKAWFVVLLVMGLLGFGLVTMLVYILAVPAPVTAPAGPQPAVVDEDASLIAR